MTRLPQAAAWLGLALAVTSACSLLPPTVECGPLPAADCAERARAITAEGTRGDPTRRIVRITFTDDRGSYQAEFDDGTATMLIVD